MGWLQRLLGVKPEKGTAGTEGKRKRGQHGPRKSKAERDAIDKSRLERDLRRNFPRQYRRLKLMEWYGLSAEDADDFLNENQDGEPGRNKDKLIDLAIAIGPIIRDLMPPRPSIQVATSIPAAELPAAAPQAQPGSNGVSKVSQEFISELSSRNPQEAAAWFTRLAERDNGMGQLLLLLRLADDAKVRDVFALVSTKAPDLAPAMAWLCSPERWDHTIATVHALREMSPT